MKFKNNVTKIMVRGVNLNRIFKEMQKNNVKMLEIDRGDYKTIKFDVENRNVKKVFAILNKPCYNVSVENRYGFSSIFQYLAKRIGVIISILFFVFLLIFNSFFVSNVKIFGCNNIALREISKTLKTGGVFVGARLNDINITKCEDILYDNFENISLVSVIKAGTSIIVSIKEKNFNIEPSNIVNNNIVSNFDATITEINVVEGTPKVKVGDSVKSGDVLVEGYNILFDGTKTKCTPNASIKAKIWFSHSLTFLNETKEEYRTGKKIENYSFSFFNLKLKTTNKKINFEKYENETKEIFAFENNFLPLKKFIITSYETKERVVTKSFEENKQKLLEECYKIANQKVPKNITISKSFDSVQEIEKGYIISAYHEAEIYL